jgi:AraC-like DNA-binding protein
MGNEDQAGIWVLEAFRRGGVDTDILAREVPDEFERALRDPENLLPRDVNTLLCACERLSGDEHFGLHMIDFVDLTMLGTYGYLLTNAPTVERFLQLATRYYPIFYRGAGLKFEVSGKTCSLEYSVEGSVLASQRHDNEWSLGFFASFIGNRIGNDWHPMRTEFTHAMPSDMGELERIFGNNISFNASRTAFEFETKDLGRTINTTDSRLLSILTDSAEALLQGISQRESFLADVRLHILSQLESGANSQDIARSMAMSRSTFKRRLAARRLTFRELRNDITKQVAIKALSETGVDISQLSRKLGYSEQSAFARAFKRLTGMCPTKYTQTQLR